MIGATIIDTALDRRGIIVATGPELDDVTVSWRPGQVTQLRPADIRAGRYRVQLPPTWPELAYRLTHCDDCGCEHEHPTCAVCECHVISAEPA